MSAISITPTDDVLYVGEIKPFTITVKDADDALADPDDLVLDYKPAGQTSESVTWTDGSGATQTGPAGAITRDSTGTFTFIPDTAFPSTGIYLLGATADDDAAGTRDIEEFFFRVEAREST